MQIHAKPLEAYSSLHEVLLFVPLTKLKWASFSIIINFSLQTPTPLVPTPLLVFHARDSDKPQVASSDFSFNHLTRWRFNISTDQSFDNYLQSLNHKKYKNYKKTEKNFINHGTRISIIEGDWSDHVEAVSRLYANVAARHPPRIYDIDFFRSLAKRSDCKLICAWVNEFMIGMIVILEEGLIIHSVCCGLDYEHSKRSYAYSWMHYEFIRFAIESKKFTSADVGFTGDEAKGILNFKPICSSLNVYANNSILRGLLRSAARLFTATITPQSKLKVRLRFF